MCAKMAVTVACSSPDSHERYPTGSWPKWDAQREINIEICPMIRLPDPPIGLHRSSSGKTQVRTLSVVIGDPPALTIHADADLDIVQHAGERQAGKLAALIRVEDLWLAEASQCFLQFRDAETGVHCVR